MTASTEILIMADRLVLLAGDVTEGMIESMIEAHAAGIPIVVDANIAPRGCACSTFEDGSVFELASFAGGAASDGEFSRVTCHHRKKDGSTEIMHYIRVPAITAEGKLDDYSDAWRRNPVLALVRDLADEACHPACTQTGETRCVACLARAALGMPRVRTEAMKETERAAWRGTTPALRMGLMYFTADWCSPCKTLKPRLEAFISKHPNAITMIKYDLTADDSPHQAIADKLKIQSIPALVWTLDGEPEITDFGVISEKKMESALAELISLSVKEPPSKRKRKSKPPRRKR